jgi:hypothetical protein
MYVPSVPVQAVVAIRMIKRQKNDSWCGNAMFRITTYKKNIFPATIMPTYYLITYINIPFKSPKKPNYLPLHMNVHLKNLQKPNHFSTKLFRDFLS